MIVRHKQNKGQAEVDEELGELLIAGGTWELHAPETPKPTRRRTVKPTTIEG